MAQYTRDNPAESECADLLYVDILAHSSKGLTVRDMLKYRNLVSVRASLELLQEEGKIVQRIEPGHDDLLDAERIFPASEYLTAIDRARHDEEQRNRQKGYDIYVDES